jgi:5-methylcytosine-specific restriction protein A
VTGFAPAVRDLIAARSNGLCEIRWECDGDPATQIHHRRPRGMGGSKRESTNLASNGIHACTACHLFAELKRNLARECGWLVPQAEDCPEAVPVLINRRRSLLEDDGTVVVLPPPVSVTCPQCPEFARNPSIFPDRDGAEAFADRHARLNAGHIVEIEAS